MDERLNLLGSYISAFRDIINAKVQPAKLSIRETLKLSKDEDWAFLCAAMDIIEDGCAAIDNFVRFGLDGPTKYNEVGESYLRLYGVLNATYIQQQAVLKVYQLINVPPTLTEAKDAVADLEIRHLRHKLASHSTDYRDEGSNSTRAYVPVRLDLTGFRCRYTDIQDNKSHDVDLGKAINEHVETMIEMLDRASHKAIETLYKGQERSKERFDLSGRLEELRSIRRGGLVIQLPGGAKVIMIVGC